MNKNIIYGTIAITIFSATTFYYFKSNPEVQIVEFDSAQHKKSIKYLFDQNWYWLVDNPEFDLEHLLEARRRSKHPMHKDRFEHIHVLLYKCKVAGAITFNMENFYTGEIHLLVVDEKFRGKGFATMLVRSAEEKLKSLGAKTVKLITKVKNFKAQNMYKKLGFKETGRDDEFIHYQHLQ